MFISYALHPHSFRTSHQYIYRVEYDASEVDSVQDLREAYVIGVAPEDVTVDLKQV